MVSLTPPEKTVLARRYLPSKRVVAAASRLAAVYAAAVTVLLLTLILLIGVPIRFLADLATLSIPAVICFAGAFLLLAVARRAGLTALWLLILALWTWLILLVRGFDDGPTVGKSFVMWSTLAAPLYAMVAIGFPALNSPPRRRLATWSIGGAWAALAVMGVKIDFQPEWSRTIWPLWTFLQLLWVAAPPALTVRALLRVYKRAPAGPFA